MTREEAIARLIECEKNPDTEGAHSDADDILCDLLRSLGYGDVVDEWVKIHKWYG